MREMKVAIKLAEVIEEGDILLNSFEHHLRPSFVTKVGKKTKNGFIPMGFKSPGKEYGSNGGFFEGEEVICLIGE